jgi:hypothetical protein
MKRIVVAFGVIVLLTVVLFISAWYIALSSASQEMREAQATQSVGR